VIRYTKDGEPYLDPSAMKALITFLEPTTTTGTSGSVTGYAPGSPPDTTWAEIVPVRGTDVIKAGQDVSQVRITATVRYRAPGRSAQDQFQDARGLVYVIQAVEDVVPGKLKYQVLTALLLSASVPASANV
jgi:head-tail adaptor